MARWWSPSDSLRERCSIAHSSTLAASTIGTTAVGACGNQSEGRQEEWVGPASLPHYTDTPFRVTAAWKESSRERGATKDCIKKSA